MCPSCPLGARARLCACPLGARVSFGRHFRCSHFGGKNTREERIFCRDLASRAQISCAEGQTGDEHIRNTKESATRTTTTQRNRASLSLNIYRTMMRSALNASSPLGNNVLRIQCASSSSSSSFKDESASSSSAKNHHPSSSSLRARENKRREKVRHRPTKRRVHFLFLFFFE